MCVGGGGGGEKSACVCLIPVSATEGGGGGENGNFQRAPKICRPSNVTVLNVCTCTVPPPPLPDIPQTVSATEGVTASGCVHAAAPPKQRLKLLF